MAFVIRGVTKGISTTLGIVGEKYYDHKDRKEQRALAHGTPETFKNPVVQTHEADAEASDTDSEYSQDDERAWALDEAADPPIYEESSAQALSPSNTRPQEQRSVSDVSVGTLVHNTFDAESAAAVEAEQARVPDARLPFPVIIPQRRPGAKGRGFARAYAPDLEACGIDQAMFLRFLKNFQIASQASPLLQALFISANIVGFVPGVITTAVSISVSVAAGTAIELQSRYKANAYLDQMNREVFMPRGLYAMVLMYKPDNSPDAADGNKNTASLFGFETVNLETAKHVAKWGTPDADASELSGTTRKIRPIRLTSGKTEGEAAMPLTVAPLIYPGIEAKIAEPGALNDEKFTDRLKRNKKFVADYFDRRARAEYAGNNPETQLASTAVTDMPQFRNRFADPNHPCNNGHLFSLLSGGAYVAQPRGMGRGRLRAKGPDGKLLPRQKRPERPVRGPISLVSKGIRKVMQENVLYLTIVNMPSEEELQAARAEMERDNKGLTEMLAQLKRETHK